MKKSRLRWDTPLWKMTPWQRMALAAGCLLVLGTLSWLVYEEYAIQKRNESADQTIHRAEKFRQEKAIEGKGR